MVPVLAPSRTAEHAPGTPVTTVANGSRQRRHVAARTLLFIGLGVGGAVLLWFRLPPLAHDTLWAEDGSLFLAGAEQHGLFGATFLPYAGYLQFLPRLIAGAVVQWLPITFWAYGMTAGACLVTGAASCVVYVASRDVFGSRLLRVMLAAVVLLVPLGPRDVLGNPTNLHSVLFWMCFWILLFRPRSRPSAAAFTLIGFAAAASEIQTVFLLPLLILALRRRHGWVLVTGPAVGIGAQLVATVLAPRTAATAAQDSPASIAAGYLVNAVLPNVFPQNMIGTVLAHGGLIVAGALLLLLTGVVLMAWRHTGTPKRVAIISAAALSVLVWTASVVDNPAPFYNYASFASSQLLHVWLTRYGVVPAMLLLGIALIAADALLRAPARHRRLTRAIAVSTAVMIGVCLIGNYIPTYTRRSAGPSWSAQIPAAQEACEGQPDGKLVNLNETLGWKVPVYCGYLRHGS